MTDKKHGKFRLSFRYSIRWLAILVTIVAVFLGGWAMDYPDGENMAILLYGPNRAPGPNDANYDHPKFNKEFEEMAILQEGARKAELLRSMEKRVLDEAVWGPLWVRRDFDLIHKWTKNYRRHAFANNTAKYIRIDTKKRADSM